MFPPLFRPVNAPKQIGRGGVGGHRSTLRTGSQQPPGHHFRHRRQQAAPPTTLSPDVLDKVIETSAFLLLCPEQTVGVAFGPWGLSWSRTSRERALGRARAGSTEQVLAPHTARAAVVPAALEVATLPSQLHHHYSSSSSSSSIGFGTGAYVGNSSVAAPAPPVPLGTLFTARPVRGAYRDRHLLKSRPLVPLEERGPLMAAPVVGSVRA